jgi:hypothetical protein
MWSLAPESWRGSSVGPGEPSPPTRAIGRSGTDCKSPVFAWPTKLAFVLTPPWLYLPMAKATGELGEYMLRAKERQAGSEHFTVAESAQLNSQDAREWLNGLKSYTRRWIEGHKDGGEDHWTVTARVASTAPGV